jgi:hypothetical protein
MFPASSLNGSRGRANISPLPVFYSLHSACCIAAQLIKQQKVSERIRELQENPPTAPIGEAAIKGTASQAHGVAVTDSTGPHVGRIYPRGGVFGRGSQSSVEV